MSDDDKPKKPPMQEMRPTQRRDESTKSQQRGDFNKGYKEGYRDGVKDGKAGLGKKDK